jgi:hypothetical protein
MSEGMTFNFTYSEEISNEAAYEIAGFLRELSYSFEGIYFCQIRAHQRAIYPRRLDLIQNWEEEKENEDDGFL